jgi:hypothetical protein
LTPPASGSCSAIPRLALVGECAELGGRVTLRVSRPRPAAEQLMGCRASTCISVERVPFGRSGFCYALHQWDADDQGPLGGIVDAARLLGRQLAGHDDDF